MTDDVSAKKARVALGILALGFVVVLAVVRHATRPPEGPIRFSPGAVMCAECGMAIRDLPFAVEVHTELGDVLYFDDPGCAFRYLARGSTRAHALYFHDAFADRWLRESEVGFLRVAQTPMGYGYAAVPRDRAGALSFDAARRVLSGPHAPPP